MEEPHAVTFGPASVVDLGSHYRWRNARAYDTIVIGRKPED